MVLPSLPKFLDKKAGVFPGIYNLFFRKNYFSLIEVLNSLAASAAFLKASTSGS